MGNFIFGGRGMDDRPWAGNSKHGAVAKCRFMNGIIQEIKLIHTAGRTAT